jgi:hypothetical protein
VPKLVGSRTCRQARLIHQSGDRLTEVMAGHPSKPGWPMAATSTGPPTSASPGSERASCPMLAHHRLSHQSHRLRGCHAECRSRNDADVVQRCPHHKLEGRARVCLVVQRDPVKQEALEAGDNRRGSGRWIVRAQAGQRGKHRLQYLAPRDRASPSGEL